PSELLVLDDGRIAISLRDKGRLDVLESDREVTRPLVRRCSRSVAEEPTGLALSPDGATLLVASRWAHAITALDAATFDVRYHVDVPRDPRAIVFTRDGDKAFVAHVAGSRISVLDLGNTVHTTRSIDLHDRQERKIVQVSMEAHFGIDEAGRKFQLNPTVGYQ